MHIKNLVGQTNPYTANKVQGQERGDPSARTQQTAQNLAKGDSVSLSGEAKLQSAAFSAASQAPDVRAEKVRSLKEQVRNGTYQPDIKKAARNLVRDELDLLVK